MRAGAKNQRLVLLVVAIVAMLGAVLLAMSALKDQASYFYAPSDVTRDGIQPGRAIRLGGVVTDHSVMRQPDGVTITFKVTDGKQTVPVRYTGIVPDLFRENSGVIAEGRFTQGGLFVADTILAKHDENYRPPELAGDKHKTETLAR